MENSIFDDFVEYHKQCLKDAKKAVIKQVERGNYEIDENGEYIIFFTPKKRTD